MNTLNKTIKNSDGSYSTISAISNDNIKLNIGKNYKLVDYTGKKNSKFKNSIFGSDIGIKNSGFASMILISTLIAIGTIVIMLISFKI
jgi:hypothetical protein